MNDYVTFSSDQFKAHITDSSFRILVRELNANKSFLRTVTLSNGQEYEPGSNAVYLAISVYKAVGSEGSMSYEVYESKFADGFVAELRAVKNTTDSGTVPDTDEEETGDEDTWKNVEEIDFTKFSNWRSGVYYHTDGKYTANATRICLNDYVTFKNKEYKVQISDTAYQMLIREMNQDMKLIKSYNLADGAIYTPSSNAVYLGISIYKKSESGVSYAVYKNLFANGFEAKYELGKESQ